MNGETAQARPAVDGDRPLAWARIAIGVALVGYTMVVLYGYVFLPHQPLQRWLELMAAVAAGVSLIIIRRKPRRGSLLMLSAVWLETTLSTVDNGFLVTPSLLVYPILVLATGLLVGPAAMLTLAITSAVGLPALLALKHAWLGQPAAPSAADGAWLVVFIAVLVGLAMIARAALRAYAQVLADSRRDRDHFSEVFEKAPDGLLVLDGRGRVLEANPVAAKLLSPEGGSLRGAALSDILQEAGLGSRLELGQARPGAPVLVELRREGQLRFLEVSVRADTTLQPEASRSLLVVRDVTERRLVDERLGHAQRLELVGQLAGGVAHDFNNLLTAVAGNASILSTHADAEVREMALEIEDARRRGTALTRQLLAFARRDAFRPEAVDLAEVVSGMSRLLERVLGERYRLELELDRRVSVFADRAHLEQVTLNLVANARDAMPEGGRVAVHVRALDGSAATARGSTLEAPAQAMLEVSDSGTGMTPEVRARIFEPFFTTKPRGQGTGLGLATVHGIVIRAGGSIAVESKPGEGARFAVFLPAVPAESPSVAAPPRPVHGGSERILVVEDEANVRALVERVLRRAGYAVTAVVSAEEALKQAPESFDLLLSDIGLPGMSGPELARRLAERQPVLRVVLMSGYWAVDDPSHPVAEPRDVLQKPFAPDELLRRVRARLDPS